MSSTGILVGCDKQQEWLLPWWWEHYAAHNAFPVAFVDLGMSENGRAWCQDKGKCFELSLENFPKDLHIPEHNQQLWEALYGKHLSDYRPAWFKKPLALLSAPFSLTIWLDLDCQVNAGLEPLFNALTFGAEIGLVREPEPVQDYLQKKGVLLPEEVYYNSGVILFRKDAKILELFAEECLHRHAAYFGDQNALCRAIFNHRPALVELPPLYNWVRILGPNPDALIYHHTGSLGKEDILKVIRKRLRDAQNSPR